MKITGSYNGDLKDFIYGTDDRCFKIDLHNCEDQKEQQIFSRVNKQLYIFIFLSGRSANVTRIRSFRVICSKELCFSYVTERTASEKILNMPSRKRYVLF